MSEAEILETVSEIMVDMFDIDDIVIGPQTTAADIEAWDSLQHIRLMIAIERKYKIKFKNSEVEALKNVGDLVRTVQAKIG
jgi:acyl carrier protein